jgi:iron-regulated transporter 1
LFTAPAPAPTEIEAKYMIIYNKYSRASEPSPTINFTFVVLLVMTGLTIVLAIPYFLLRKKGAKGGSGGSLSTSFAQMLTQSKKKQSGHIN